MTAGDPIWYRQESRGGYGYISDVPGVFVRLAGRRICVELQLKDGGTKTVYVKLENVRPRAGTVRVVLKDGRTFDLTGLTPAAAIGKMRALGITLEQIARTEHVLGPLPAVSS